MAADFSLTRAALGRRARAVPPGQTTSGPDGAFSIGAFWVTVIVLSRIGRPPRNVPIASAWTLEPLHVADPHVAIPGGLRLRALLMKPAAVLGVRRRCGPALAHEKDRGAGADSEERSLRVSRRPHQERQPSCPKPTTNVVQTHHEDASRLQPSCRQRRCRGPGILGRSSGEVPGPRRHVGKVPSRRRWRLAPRQWPETSRDIPTDDRRESALERELETSVVLGVAEVSETAGGMSTAAYLERP